MTPWILYDFRCPRRTSSIQKYYNRKGLCSADKKNKKTASAADLAGFDVEVRGLDSWKEFERNEKTINEFVDDSIKGEEESEVNENETE